ARRIGGDLLTLGDPWGSSVTELGPVTVADSRLAAIVVSTVVIGAVFALFRFTSWGLSLRAAAEDLEAAALMGVRLGRIRAGAWCLAGALAALAAVFLAAFPAPGLERTTGQIALNAFPAAILGGLASPAGALAGSLLIGLTEAMVVGYQSDLHMLGDGFGDVAPYAVMLLVLLVRATGLFCAKGDARVLPSARRPHPPPGVDPGARPRPVPAAVLPGRLLAAHRPVLHGGGHRRDRPGAAVRDRRPALPGPRLLPRRRGVRLRLLRGRPRGGSAPG